MLLTWLWVVPAVGAILIWAAELWIPAFAGMTTREAYAGMTKSVRLVSLFLTFCIFAYSIALVLPFLGESGALRLVGSLGNNSYGIEYKVGADGISLALCWLTSLLTFLALAASPKEMSASYWASFLALEAFLFGVFVAQNLFYFYVFWDLALIPMFFIIGLWGSAGRRHASLKFILYTFLGSLALLVGIVALVAMHHEATGIWTWDISSLRRSPLGPNVSLIIFALMALGFAVKIPIVPFHNWLPDAHTEAPMAGSVLLAGSMLKMGVYGFLRILLPVFPNMSAAFFPVFGALGALNILYGALCAMAQTDLKRLVAYTSVSHLGFCVLGLFSLTSAGITGGSLQMINHGLSTGGLFLLVGMLYERTHHRGLMDFGDLARRAPGFAFFFAVILLSSIGLPGLNGFVGEFLSLAGTVKVSPMLAGFGLMGTVLAAAYGLPAYQKVFWEPAGAGSSSAKVTDLDHREKAVLWCLVGLIIWLGLYPKPFMDLMAPAVSALAMR